MMINLTRKLKKEDGPNGSQRRAFIRDKLLVREIQEMEQSLPKGCSVYFTDPNILHEFLLTIQPDEGYWRHGKFKFTVAVPEEYNMTVSGICPLCSPSRMTANLHPNCIAAP